MNSVLFTTTAIATERTLNFVSTKRWACLNHHHPLGRGRICSNICKAFPPFTAWCNGIQCSFSWLFRFFLLFRCSFFKLGSAFLFFLPSVWLTLAVHQHIINHFALSISLFVPTCSGKLACLASPAQPRPCHLHTLSNTQSLSLWKLLATIIIIILAKRRRLGRGNVIILHSQSRMSPKKVPEFFQ